MTKEEAIKDLEKYFEDADKCISEDPEYIRGWKCAMLVTIEAVGKIEGASE